MAISQQKKLEQFVARRHPLYEEMEAHWDFLESTYPAGQVITLERNEAVQLVEAEEPEALTQG
jgi:hypothetical protein